MYSKILSQDRKGAFNNVKNYSVNPISVLCKNMDLIKFIYIM